ncbi:MAG: hypothetical protein HZB38_04960 [Planctomycetes bacterium]|nr:hypothetical protein [Planctomycetota bacterium]
MTGAWIATAAAAQPASLEPAWTWTTPARIEWCVPVGGERPHALLVLTRDGQLNRLQMLLGRKEFDDPPRIPAAARFVGEMRGRAFLFDEHSAWAIETGTQSPKPEKTVAWKVDLVGAEQGEAAGDPEFRSRALDAAVTQKGVVIVRSDGRVGELRFEGGALRWSAQLPRTSDAQVKVLGSRCVILHRTADGVSASRFDLDSDAPTPQTTRLADSWPPWSGLTADGLVAVWPNRVLRASHDGSVERARLQFRSPLKMENVGVLSANQTPATRPLLLALDSRQELAAHDVCSGEQAWHVSLADWQQLHAEIDGSIIRVYDARGRLAAYHGDGGELIASYVDGQDGRSLSARTSPAFLFGLRQAQGRHNGSPTGEMLQLVRTPVFRPGEWSKDRARAGQREWSVNLAALPRTVIWPPGRLVLIEEKQIRVFVLPTE